LDRRTIRYAAKAPTAYVYTIKKDNQDLIKSGSLDLASGKAKVEVKSDEPAMLFLEIVPSKAGAMKTRRSWPEQAVGPTKLSPIASRPADFDAFGGQDQVAEGDSREHTPRTGDSENPTSNMR